MKIFNLFLMLIMCVFILMACANPESLITPDEEPSPVIAIQDEEPSPLTEIQEEESGYPVSRPTQDLNAAYPIETPEPKYPQGPEFSLDEPVEGGDLVITGTGPAGLPIILVDVSEVGLLLGETIIGEDGTFRFDLDEPVQSQHAIGIQLGDISGTDFNESDFLYSETYFVRPLIGTLFAMVFVK